MPAVTEFDNCSTTLRSRGEVVIVKNMPALFLSFFLNQHLVFVANIREISLYLVSWTSTNR